MAPSEPPFVWVREKKKRCSLERHTPSPSCKNGGHHRNQQPENSRTGARRRRPTTSGRPTHHPCAWACVYLGGCTVIQCTLSHLIPYPSAPTPYYMGSLPAGAP
ncbi:hypothetical protein V6N13_088922 [Hibiscus sabdariffa]|uniref:Uncharacterized protein n=1 Tax=Hibiscus sabdariffa TaxID=183260 RepID=A0ABR2G0T4_9ROSI